ACRGGSVVRSLGGLTPSGTVAFSVGVDLASIGGGAGCAWAPGGVAGGWGGGGVSAFGAAGSSIVTSIGWSEMSICFSGDTHQSATAVNKCSAAAMPAAVGDM